MKETLCTDTSVWELAEKGDRKVCKILAAGRLCKKAVAQMLEAGGGSSTVELACLNLYKVSLEELTKEEKLSLEKSYAIAEAKYDQLINEKLLTEFHFHQNAKILTILRSLGKGDSKAAAYFKDGELGGKSSTVVVLPAKNEDPI